MFLPGASACIGQQGVHGTRRVMAGPKDRVVDAVVEPLGQCILDQSMLQAITKFE